MQTYKNDRLQCDNKACFTGPTPGSNNEYLISQHFEKLVVDKEKAWEFSVSCLRSGGGTRGECGGNLDNVRTLVWLSKLQE